MAERARGGSPGLARAAPFVVGFLTLLVFSAVLRNGFVNWDDQLIVLDNHHIRELTPANLVWMFNTYYGAHYQPLTWLTLAFDHAVWGLDPLGYHLTSLLIHAINGGLVCLLFTVLLRRPESPGESYAVVWAAALGALAWSLHPLRVENVAWIADRGSPLCAAFLILALLTYVRRGGAHSNGTLFLYFAAMLSKGWGITLPVILLVIDALVLRRFAGADRAARRAIFFEKIPYFALAGIFGLLSLLAKATTHSLASGASHGFVARLLQSTYAVWFYLAKTLAPFDLSPIYPLEGQLAEPGLLHFASLLAFVAVTALLVWRWRLWNAALAAWASFVILLSPVLGFTQAGPQIAADRYTYLAALPLLALLAAVLRQALDIPGHRRWLLAGSALVLAALGVGSVLQLAVWRDGVSLWGHALALHPDSGKIRYFWANTLLERGDYARAIDEYTVALEFRVDDRIGALNNRASAHHLNGDIDLAMLDLTAAIRIRPTASSHFNRGLMRYHADEAGAIDDWHEAIRLDPNAAGAYRMLGHAHEERGDAARAIANYESALEKAHPDWRDRAEVERRLAALRERID